MQLIARQCFAGVLLFLVIVVGHVMACGIQLPWCACRPYAYRIELVSRSGALAVPRTPAELVKLVTDLANKPTSFYDLAHRLHELHDASATDFRKVSTNGVVGRRRAYQLVRIARVFGPSKVSVPHLEAVGFTKLNLLAEANEKGKVFTAAEVEFLVDWAAQHTVKALRDRLANDPDKKKKRVVAIYLSQTEYPLYRAAMIKFGAAEVGKGLVGQEKALMELIANLTPEDGAP